MSRKSVVLTVASIGVIGMKNGHFSSQDAGRQLSEKAQFYMTSWQSLGTPVPMCSRFETPDSHWVLWM